MNPDVPALFAALPESQTPISALELPSWVERRLLRHRQPIDTVEKLLVLNQRYLYYFVYRIGRKALEEINCALSEHGYPELPWKPIAQEEAQMPDSSNPSIYDVKGINRCFVVGRAVHCRFGDPGLKNLTRMTETDLVVIKGIGPATIRSIRRELASRSLALKGERPPKK